MEEASAGGTDVCLPYVCIQPDYVDVCTDVAEGVISSERVWLSVYCDNAPHASVHAKLMACSPARGAGVVDVKLEDRFADQLSVDRVDPKKLDLRVKTTSQHGSLMANTRKSTISLPPVNVRTPRRTMGPLVTGALGATAFDVSPGETGMYVVAGGDGQAHVGMLGDGLSQERKMQSTMPEANDDIESTAQRRIHQRLEEQRAKSKTHLRGHDGDVRSARFFPTGEHVLTTSSDCTLNAFRTDGTRLRTFTGHRRAVLDCAIFDEGKQMLSGSSDGSTRLWDVSKDKSIASFPSENFSEVQALAVNDANEGKQSFVLAGLSSGTIELYDVRSRSCISRLHKHLFPAGPPPKASDSWEQIMSGAIESLDLHGDRHRLLAGCRNGVTKMYDLRMLPSSAGSEFESLSSSSGLPLACWKRDGAAVNDVRFLSGGQEAILATADGTPYRVNVQGEHPFVVDEYCGWEVDNVSACRVDANGRIWLAGAGGMARMYD